MTTTRGNTPNQVSKAPGRKGKKVKFTFNSDSPSTGSTAMKKGGKVKKKNKMKMGGKVKC